MIFQTIKPGTKNGRWARPQVTMNAKGHMKINRVAFEMLGMPERVRVLFDKRSQTIALTVPQEAAEVEDSHTCIAHGHHGEHGGRLIRVYGLVEEIQGELYTCIRFKEPRMDEHGRLILELSKSVPAYNGTRIGVFKEWKAKRMAETNAKAKANYALRRDRKGGRTVEEWREDLAIMKAERERLNLTHKARLRAERDLAREQRKLEKECAARIARDKQYQDLVDDLKRRKEELEAIRRPFITPPPTEPDDGEATPEISSVMPPCSRIG
jgi:hypothetical protein